MLFNSNEWVWLRPGRPARGGSYNILWLGCRAKFIAAWKRVHAHRNQRLHRWSCWYEKSRHLRRSLARLWSWLPREELRRGWMVGKILVVNSEVLIQLLANESLFFSFFHYIGSSILAAFRLKRFAFWLWHDQKFQTRFSRNASVRTPARRG